MKQLKFKVGDRVIYTHSDYEFKNKPGIIKDIIEPSERTEQLRVHFDGDIETTAGLYSWKFRILTPLEKAML